MTCKRFVVVTVAVVAVLVSGDLIAQTAQRAQPVRPGEVPPRKTLAPLPPRGTYDAPRTPWGDPDIAGVYTNSDESGIPFSAPTISPAGVSRMSRGRLGRLGAAASGDH